MEGGERCTRKVLGGVMSLPSMIKEVRFVCCAWEQILFSCRKEKEKETKREKKRKDNFVFFLFMLNDKWNFQTMGNRNVS